MQAGPQHFPNLARLGIGNIKPLAGIATAESPAGAYGLRTLASPGKDTTPPRNSRPGCYWQSLSRSPLPRRWS